jgi:hypothetical protein
MHRRISVGFVCRIRFIVAQHRDQEAKIGCGDNLMATGMARGLAKRGKRAAFGDGRKIIWDHHSEMIFGARGTQTENKNVAWPGDEGGTNLVWFRFYRGERIYNTLDRKNDRWIWNLKFQAHPGEIFFSDAELAFAEQAGKDFVVIEPNVPEFKTCAPNKQWPVDRYQTVARLLSAQGREVVQFVYGSGVQLKGVRSIGTPSFRHALAVLERSALYIGPEGGLHHGAAAVDIPAVVLFGGFIPPKVTGYATHTNLTGNVQACGSLKPCHHCKSAMAAITVDHVLTAAHEIHHRSSCEKLERGEGNIVSI